MPLCIPLVQENVIPTHIFDSVQKLFKWGQGQVKCPEFKLGQPISNFAHPTKTANIDMVVSKKDTKRNKKKGYLLLTANINKGITFPTEIIKYIFFLLILFNH
jgi:hypothetical protein